MERVPSALILEFQSTLSMRRATFLSTVFNIRNYISIHALHEESDYARFGVWVSVSISIHALHEESEGTCGGCQRKRVISIHALHEESDFSEKLLAVVL